MEKAFSAHGSLYECLIETNGNFALLRSKSRGRKKGGRPEILKNSIDRGLNKQIDRRSSVLEKY